MIKVITRSCRCRKSTLLQLYQPHLLDLKINDSQIISINFEEMEYENLLDYRKLYQYMKEN